MRFLEDELSGRYDSKEILSITFKISQWSLDVLMSVLSVVLKGNIIQRKNLAKIGVLILPEEKESIEKLAQENKIK